MPEDRRRIETVLRTAGLSPDAATTASRVADGVYRLRSAGQDLACKLFAGPAATERLRTEAAAYEGLHPRDAPVPRLLACDRQSGALLRTWVQGESLSAALRSGRAADFAAPVLAAWQRLLAALDPWTQALEPARLSRARDNRLAELRAVAGAVCESSTLRATVPEWDRCAADILALPEIIARETPRTLPLDLAPGNLIVGAGGVTFIDLELLGLDFPASSLCKATMLGCDPSGAGAGVALFADGLPDSSAPNARAIDAAFMLLALADAAGLWRPAHPAPADLTLARGTPALSAETRRLRSRLDYT